jgi:UDP-N-acetylglucosamine 2-epimerase (non-hydrolysing)
MNKIGIILGTRPEIIKMCPIVYELIDKGMDYFIIHTGQHYSFELDKVFFKDLRLSKPRYNLEVGSGEQGEMTGKMLIAIEDVLQKEKPDCVLVQGDTNSVLAGALAATKLGIKIGHIEAGNRSYDRNMPEEINRVLVDHISDFLFVPTDKARGNLLKEGIDKAKIFIVGNTIVDAVLQNINIARKETLILEELKISEKEYSLLTLHRPSNVDNKDSLVRIFNAFERLSEMGVNNILFPIHPRTEKNITNFGLQLPKNIKKIKPVGYLDMLILMDAANIILTDSGGLQEEACVLKTPCVTLRYNTERPETIDVGSNLLVGDDVDKIVVGAKKMLAKKTNWSNPFGDGYSAEQIINILKTA